MCFVRISEQTAITLVSNLFTLRIKIQGNSYGFDISESEYDNQIALTPTKVKENGLNSQTNFVTKMHYIGFYLSYTIHRHIMHNVYMYGTPTRTIFIKHFIFFLHPPAGVPL
jgi:hypothetical protein